MEQSKSTLNLLDSGRRQESDNVLIDRISALPDSILGLILSFLPTEEVVATTFLSKRWRFVWRIIHNLDFFSEGFGEKENGVENVRFVEFVNRVLLLHDGGFINKFSLVWNPLCITSHATSWINTAITKNVHELVVCAYACTGPLEMPESVFISDSLQSLELTHFTYFNDAFAVCLPRLERLKIDSVYFEHEEACEKLINGCPILNHLHLNISNDGFRVVISSVSLKHLEICLRYMNRLKLKASSLEYLRLNGDLCEIFVEESLSSLVQADVDFEVFRDYDFPKNSIIEAARAFDCAKVLTLSAEAMWAFCQARSNFSTEFKRLVKLRVKTCYNSLPDFIQSSDNLEVLIIDKGLKDKIGIPYHSKWATLVEVPGCLSNSLKEVRFDCYKGSKDEHEMIRFILKHGSALEIMQITCSENIDKEKFELLQEVYVSSGRYLRAVKSKSPNFIDSKVNM